MCKMDLRWKLGLLSKIGAFRENECEKGAVGVKTGLLWKTQGALYN